MVNNRRFICMLTIMIIGTYFYVDPISLQASSVHEITSETKEDFQFTPLILTIIIIGGFITITLSYVSWKKYKAEKKKQTSEKDKSVD